MARVLRLDSLEQFQAVTLLSDPGYDPGNVTIPDCIEVKMVWTQEDATLAAIILHGRVSPAFTPTPAIATAILNGLTTGGAWTTLAAFLANTGGLQGLLLRDIRTADQPYVSSTGAGANGSSASAALPSEVALVVTKRTAKVGPAFRGRAYVPNYATNALGATNVAAAAAVTATQNWAATWLTVLSGQGLTLCLGLHSRKAYTGISGTQHPARAATTELVTQLVVRDNHWDSQRRRGLR